MPYPLRRIVFGVIWFGVFWAAFLVIGGGIAGAVAGADVHSASPGVRQEFRQSQELGMKAGIEFRERYGRWVMAGAVLVSTVCTVAGVLPGTRRY